MSNVAETKLVSPPLLPEPQTGVPGLGPSLKYYRRNVHPPMRSDVLTGRSWWAETTAHVQGPSRATCSEMGVAPAGTPLAIPQPIMPLQELAFIPYATSRGHADNSTQKSLNASNFQQNSGSQLHQSDFTPSEAMRRTTLLSQHYGIGPSPAIRTPYKPTGQWSVSHDPLNDRDGIPYPLGLLQRHHTCGSTAGWDVRSSQYPQLAGPILDEPFQWTHQSKGDQKSYNETACKRRAYAMDARREFSTLNVNISTPNFRKPPQFSGWGETPRCFVDSEGRSLHPQTMPLTALQQTTSDLPAKHVHAVWIYCEPDIRGRDIGRGSAGTYVKMREAGYKYTNGCSMGPRRSGHASDWPSCERPGATTSALGRTVSTARAISAQAGPNCSQLETKGNHVGGQAAVHPTVTVSGIESTPELYAGLGSEPHTSDTRMPIKRRRGPPRKTAPDTAWEFVASNPLVPSRRRRGRPRKIRPA